MRIDVRPEPTRAITLRVNGLAQRVTVPVRKTLLDFLREDLGLKSVHVGCEHGVCGACSILLDNELVRSCNLFAVQVDGHEVTTVEGLGTMDNLHPIQQAFWDNHALQCGYCTPGMIMATYYLLKNNPNPSEGEIRDALSGNLCRCTGYMQIVDAVKKTAQWIASPKA